MKVYKVLWFDDEHENLELIKDAARSNGIILHSVTNEVDGIRELEKGLHLYDAVIVDGKFYRKPGQSGDAIDDNAWASVARYLDAIANKKKMPWFILSGEVSITKDKNAVVDLFKPEKIYNKYNDDDVSLLWEDIKAAADTQYDTQLRHKYRRAFEVCTNDYIGVDAAASLLYILTTVKNDDVNSDTEERINSVRKIVEKILHAFNRIGVLPTEVLKGRGGLNSSSKFLCNALRSYSYTEEILPPAIAFLLQSVMQVTQDGSHADGDLSIKADQFIKSQPTGYFFKSLVFQLLEILVWLKSYFDNHTDHQRNQLIAVLKEPSSAIIEGCIEQDSFNNYFCGDCLLGYKAVDGRFRIGDKIIITEIADNTQSKTSHLYAKFAAKFTKAN